MLGVPLGDFTRIRFIEMDAPSNSMAANFRIETAENPEGAQSVQLRYTQTVILDFPVPGPD